MGESLALVVAAGALALAWSPSAQEPLPVDRSTVLKDQGGVYTIEGRVLLDSRVDLESQRAITLRGVGEGATLVVAGSFKAKAVLGGKNRFENLTIELTPECRELHLAHVTWTGGGIRTAPGAPADADIYCEFLELGKGAEVDLVCTEGSVDLQASSFAESVSIRGEVPEKKKRNTTKVELLTCKGGFNGGLFLYDLADVTVRNCLVAGLEARLERIVKLDFDGNQVRAATTDFIADHYKAFGKTKVRNTDFAAGRVRVFAPADGDKRKKLSFDHCWFRGFTDEEVILREVVSAGTQDSECGVLASFARISSGPLGLGGEVPR